MTRRSRIVLAVGAVAVLGLLGAGAVLIVPALATQPVAPGRTAPAAPVRAIAAPAPAAGEVTISGRVVDLVLQRPVAGVEVVLRGEAGDAAATTGRDGGYAIRVARGAYRAFVRSDTVLSLGRRDGPRLPWHPPAEIARVPDEGLMAAVVATGDTAGVDLAVVRPGIVAGHVVDPRGRPVAGAVLHAMTAGMRPVLATDIAESAADGSFELRLPPGRFELVADHPRFAGIDGPTTRAVRPDQRIDLTVSLTPGCVISGSVAAPGGGRAGDGAIERQWGTGDLEFAPVGAVDADGAFRWATTDDAEVTLRAWPWRSPPSQARRFRCRDGARFDGVVFQVADERPDLDGALVDRAGRPLAFAFLDLRPLDPGGVGQQERTGASGRWAVYRVPPGRYRAVAQAEGGVASAVIASPHHDARLELGGTGRLEGTTPHLASGSFELVLERCFDGSEAIPLAQSRRLVTVAGGRFSVDGLPACPLSLAAVWRGRALAQQVAIPAGGVARLELELGEPRDKTVRGVVRDAAGEPVASAVVSVVRPDDPTRVAATVHTDARGGYTVRAFSGAIVRAAAGGKIGRALVGGANIDAEQVDVVIGDDADD